MTNRDGWDSQTNVLIDQGRARGDSPARIAEVAGVSVAMVLERFEYTDDVANGIYDRPSNDVEDLAVRRLAKRGTK